MDTHDKVALTIAIFVFTLFMFLIVGVLRDQELIHREKQMMIERGYVYKEAGWVKP